MKIKRPKVKTMFEFFLLIYGIPIALAFCLVACQGNWPGGGQMTRQEMKDKFYEAGKIITDQAYLAQSAVWGASGDYIEFDDAMKHLVESKAALTCAMKTLDELIRALEADK